MPDLPRHSLDSRGRWLIALTVLVALLPRLWVAATTTYTWDEDRDWIRIANGISLSADDLHLPIREGQHGALAAYFIRAGAEIAGPNPIGYRLFGILAGLIAVGLATAWGYRWAGPVGGLFAGGLLAFNEYHIFTSAVAMARGYMLTFALGAVVAFADFLERERARSLYLAAGLAGIAFLCKATAALLLPAGALVLILTRRGWLRRRTPYLAVLLFVAIVSPDVWWNLNPTNTGVERGYGDHLSRILGVGITYQPFVLYFGDAVQGVLEAVGRPFLDVAEEYPKMNVLFGMLLWAPAVLLLLPRYRPRSVDGFLVLAFWSILAFFTLIETRSGETGMDPVAWNWADVTILPAVLLAARATARLSRRTVLVAAGVAVVGAGIAAVRAAGSFDLGPIRLGACPETIWPPDGRYVPVTIRVHRCALCGPEWLDLVLLDVGIQGAGRTETVLGTDRVRGADVGEADRELELAAAAFHGDREPVYGILFGPADSPATPDRRRIATVRVAESVRYRPRFWACGPP